MKKIYLYFLTSIITFGLYAQDLQEDTIRMVTEPGYLEASLTQPPDPSSNVVLIIPGSGPTDRNGNSAMGLNNNSLKMVAEALSKADIPSLRIDKRGVAGSKSALISEKDLKLEVFIQDVNAWINLLTDSIGYEAVIIMGHSQGSLIGMLAAQGNPKVSGFISLAGSAESIDQILLSQIGKQAPVLLDETEVILDSLRKGYQVKEVFPLLQPVFRPSVQPFLISYIKYNPAEEISKLKIPALIINGTTDIQVDTGNAEKLDSAASRSQLVVVEGMNHVLKEAPEDMVSNAATYNQPELPLADGLMAPVIDFINELN